MIKKKKCKTKCYICENLIINVILILICNKPVIISWISMELDCEKHHINSILSVVSRSWIGQREGHY